MDVINELKRSFKSGNALTKLIYINLAVFLAVKIIEVIFFLLNVNPTFSLINWLAVPADFKKFTL
jgi:hypothetical protein